MKNPLAANQQNKTCQHADTVAGSASGIRRVVCKDCGNVSVSHIGVGVTKGMVEQAINREDEPI